MKMMSENFENVKRVFETNNGIGVTPVIPLVMKDAIDDAEKVQKHLQGVKKALDDRTKSIITDNPGTGYKMPKNIYTQPVKLDEDIEDFSIEDYQSRK